MELTLGMLWTSAEPVAQIVIMCLAGAVLARMDILNQKARQHLSQLVFYVFVPALSFTKLGESVDLKQISRWWPLPVNTALSIVMGLTIGVVSAWLLRAPRHLRPHIIAATGLGNVGNLPLVLVASLCADEKSPIAQVMGPTCESKGLAYVAFSMWVAGVVQFSIGYNLMKPSPEQLLERQLASPGKQMDGADSARQPMRSGRGPAQNASGTSEDEELLPLREQSALEMQPVSGAEVGHDETTSLTLYIPAEPETGVDDAQFLAADERPRQAEPLRQSHTGTSTWLTWREWAVLKGRPLCHRCWQDFLTFWNPPTTGAAAGLVVGCIPWAKGLLFGSGAPLGFVTDCLDRFASAMIPCMMLILGAVLHKGPGTGSLPPRVILGVLISRQLIVPALGTGMVLALQRLHIFSPPIDPLFFVVMLLTHTTPTAINMQTVSCLHNNGEQEMSVLLFYQYVMTIFTLPIFLAAYVQIVKNTPIVS